MDHSERGDRWCTRFEEALRQPIADVTHLSGGCVGDVRRVRLASGVCVVVKLDESERPTLSIEARMLRDLAFRSSLPVPVVLHSDPGMLVMEHVDHDGRLGSAGEEHAAELLADLHTLEPEEQARFGYDFDTLIGGLPQPNPPCDSWIEFFARHRLLEMARQAHDAGQLSAIDRTRVDRLAERLDRFLVEPEAPSLIHGDVWSGNVLAHAGRVVALIDPAIYLAHPEIELAFIQLFGTFGPRFFGAYADRRPIADGFFQERCGLYNLYPLLVHVRLFGGGYIDQVHRTLRRFGV